jgi:hypothetical protein
MQPHRAAEGLPIAKIKVDVAEHLARLEVWNCTSNCTLISNKVSAVMFSKILKR